MHHITTFYNNIHANNKIRIYFINRNIDCKHKKSKKMFLFTNILLFLYNIYLQQ